MTETTPNPYRVTETRPMTDAEYDDAKNTESAMLETENETGFDAWTVWQQLRGCPARMVRTGTRKEAILSAQSLARTNENNHTRIFVRDDHGDSVFGWEHLS